MIRNMSLKGAKIDGVDAVYSNSPISNAVDAGRADVVKILIAHGAKVRPSLSLEVKATMKDAAGDPAMTAAYQQILEMLKT